MEKVLALIFVISALAADVCQAGTLYHTQTSLGKKIGQVQVSTSALVYQSIPGFQYNTDKSLMLNIFFRDNSGAELSAIIAQAPTYVKYCEYVKAATGSDMFNKGAPLYGNVEAIFKSAQEIAKASRILSNPQVNIEVYEGTQNLFVYMEGWNEGHPILNAQDCSYDLNSPVWTLRLSANGEYFDLPYDRSSTIVSSVYMRGVGKKIFPRADRVEIIGQMECLRELQAVQNNPKTFEMISASVVAK